MSDDSASAYGERHAPVYDRIYGARFVPDAAVETLAAAAGQGAVLEMGIGTGRLALPLAARGVAVEGIEASAAMIRRLQAQPGSERVVVHQVDLAGFDLPRTDFAVVVCAVSTLFMLSHEDQCTALQAAARHLRPRGTLFIETFRPDPTRFDRHGRRVEIRTPAVGSHIVRSRDDPIGRSITIEHELSENGSAQTYAVTLYYASAEELDAMARRAGLRLVDRWHDWTRAPIRPASKDPVSVYSN